jgi:hypothetical protein
MEKGGKLIYAQSIERGDFSFLLPKATMSLVGQTLPNWAVGTMSGLSPLATELRTSLMVRFVPDSDINYRRRTKDGSIK